MARRIALGKTGSIKIGFTATTAYGFMPDLIASCRTRRPEVDLSLKEMVSGDQLEALVSGLIDIGLLRPPIGRPEFASMRVVAERLLVAFPQGHAFADRDAVAPRELDGQPFVIYSPYESRYFHDLVVTLFTRAATLPRYVQHLSQIHSTLAMVCAGLGLAIVPETARNLNFRGVELRPLRLRGAPPVETYLVWRRDDDSPLLPSLIEIAGGLASAQARQD